MSNSVESIAKNKRIKLRNNIERIDNTMTKLSKETIENFFKTYSEMEELIVRTLVPSLSSFHEVCVDSIEIEVWGIDVVVEDPNFHCRCGHCHPDKEYFEFPAEAFYDTKNWIKHRLELKQQTKLKEQEEKKRKEEERLAEKEKTERKVLEKLKNKYEVEPR
jgi:hypothetical protein